MSKIISLIITPVFYAIFYSSFVLYHPVILICKFVGGYPLYQKSINLFNGFLFSLLWLLGIRCKLINPKETSTKRPLIIVSNHQSMFDIPFVVWNYKKHHVKYVAKKELAKGFPVVSYNLRNGGCAIVDRKNPDEAVKVLEEFGQYLEKNKFCGAIYPEGSRSRNGKPKPFKTKGLRAILRNCPSAVILPMSINHSYLLNRFPLPMFKTLTWTVHEPMDVRLDDLDNQLQEIEQIILSGIQQ